MSKHLFFFVFLASSFYVHASEVINVFKDVESREIPPKLNPPSPRLLRGSCRFHIQSEDSGFLATANNPYLPYAQRWASEYIQGADKKLLISQDDFEHIKELVKISLYRAQVILQSQEVMWQSMHLCKQAWENLISTRLNPAKQFPNVITNQQKQNVINQFWQAHDVYEAACKDYCAVAQRVVHGNILQTPLAKDAVNAMRQEVRVCMIDALADVKKQLESVYAILLKNADLDNDQTKALKQQLSIASFLIDYVPNLVMHQFIKADAFYTQLSNDSWSVFEKIQLIGNQAWHAIESARAAFYQALLDELNRIDI